MIYTNQSILCILQSTNSPTLESAVHLLLDTDANTIKTQLMESPSETYCFDKIIKPENYSNSLHGYLVNQTLEDSFNGFNSSILLTNSQSCDVNRLIQGDDLYEGLFPDLLLSLFNKKLKSSTLTTSVYELHGEVLRDLLSPQTGNLQLDFVDSDYVIKHLKRYHINNLQDISTVQNLVKANQAGHKADLGKVFVFYSIAFEQSNIQSTAIGNNSLSSRITIVKCASTNYPFMDRNKLILSEGFNFSNSVSALYDTVEKRDVQFCSGLLNRLLLEELGGNCKSRWLSVVDTNELDHMRTFWHFRWCQNINGLYNYPIQNDFNYKKIRARDFANFCMEKQSVLNAENNVEIIENQKIVDITLRLNSVIAAKAKVENELKQTSNRLIMKEKLALDAEIQSSRLEDDIMLLKEQIREAIEKEKKALKMVTEKVGHQNTLKKQMEMTGYKITELEFRILQLLSNKTSLTKENERIKTSMSQLKKHNLFLQHNYTPKVPKQKEMLSTASVPPTTTECTEMRKDLEFVVSRLGELSQQNQSIMEEYRMKLHDYTSQFETDQLDIHELYQEIIETYKANETRLQSQLETLSSVFKTTNGSIPTDKALELKLHQFTRDTMLHLEKDRCSLIAKCAALEEELSNQ